jgi:hypothetical protein
MRNLFLSITILLIWDIQAPAQSPDRKAVYEAARDYVEAMYKSEPYRIERSVDHSIVRRGYYWKGLDSTYSDLKVMSYEQILQYAKDWNKSGWLPANAPETVDVYDVQDKIACAKITAYWGTEYLQLAKVGEKWKILHILWQGIPKKASQKK